MENTINKLLRVNIEIEGLIRVLAAAKSDPFKHNAAKEMLLEKASELVVLIERDSAEPDRLDEGMPQTSESPIDEIKIETSVESSVQEEGKRNIISTEKFFVSPPKVDTPNEVDEKLQLIEDTNDFAEEETIPNMPKESGYGHQEPTYHPVEEEAPAFLADKLDPKDTRLEDVLAKKEKKNLISAFTLNDKFRFIKGIFGDDPQDFDYTLDRLSECESLAEVYDYLLNDQGWDIDNDDIKDFISIIATYFNA